MEIEDQRSPISDIIKRLWGDSWHWLYRCHGRVKNQWSARRRQSQRRTIDGIIACRLQTGQVSLLLVHNRLAAYLARAADRADGDTIRIPRCSCRGKTSIVVVAARKTGKGAVAEIQRDRCAGDRIAQDPV